MNNGLIYIPKFVRQTSDMEYGSVVTHENYNEKLNLNMDQGDYNTEVLRILFTEKEMNKTYRIPYLEKYTDDTVADLRSTFYDLQGQITTNKNNIEVNKTAIGVLDKALSAQSLLVGQIITGAKTVGHAKLADKITGIDEAGVHRYYGTDYDGLIGFHEVPDSIYAEDIESSSPDISGIYFTPRENSVAENMLTESVRAKLNKASITSYPELSDLPKINNVEVNGTLTLVDLGIQPAGNYLTEIPDTYALKSYVDSAVSPLLSSNTAATTYATITALNTLENKVNTNASTVASTYSRVFIGSVPSGVTPKKGDLLVDL